MIGFKAFNKDLTCKGFQYEIGHTYKFDGDPIPCKQGFHFCKSIAETYIYYDMNENTRICKIEAIGDIETDDEIKYCTNAIKICEEITEDWVRKGNCSSSSSGYCNTGGIRNEGNRNTGNHNRGDHNTGDWNTGDYNTGDYNTSDWNTGNYNAGRLNTGDHNTGICNSGDYNTGDFNTGNNNKGDRNTGYQNTGYRNTGCQNTGTNNAGDYNTGGINTGNYNTGYYNTGDCNTGNWNSGDWNCTDYSTGCFNTEEKNIIMFNKITNWTFNQWLHSKAHNILSDIPKEPVKWIDADDMSDEEKEQYPTYITTGGYLKVLDKESAAQDYWNGLSKDDKQEIYELPNFDKDIFKQCTGIEV